MRAKLFEVRDRGTLMSGLAVKLDPANEAEAWLLRRSGFETTGCYILFGTVDGGAFHYDEYDVSGNSTRFTAIKYIREHFDDLEPGQVICTEFIRGERDTPKESERQ